MTCDRLVVFSGYSTNKADRHDRTEILLYRVHIAWAGFEFTMLVVIGTDCIGSCKSNYHTITTAPQMLWTYRKSVGSRINLISQQRNFGSEGIPGLLSVYGNLFVPIKILFPSPDISADHIQGRNCHWGRRGKLPRLIFWRRKKKKKRGREREREREREGVALKANFI